MGFALRLRALAFSDSLVVKYDKSSIAKKLRISRPTLYKRLAELKEAGIYDGKFSENYCEAKQANKLNEENTKLMEDIINSCQFKVVDDKIKVIDLSESPYPKKDVLQAVYFYNKGQHLLPNADMTFYKMLGGM